MYIPPVSNHVLRTPQREDLREGRPQLQQALFPSNGREGFRVLGFRAYGSQRIFPYTLNPIMGTPQKGTINFGKP